MNPPAGLQERGALCPLPPWESCATGGVGRIVAGSVLLFFNSGGGKYWKQNEGVFVTRTPTGHALAL